MAEEDNNEENVTHINIGTAAAEGGVLHQGDNIASLGGGGDVVDGQGGFNAIDAGSGDDTSFNTSNSGTWDVVMGGSGNDYIIGPSGGYLNARGGSGRDVIIGGANSDYIFGDEGEDILIGGGGDDTIVGGEGDDTLIGGIGSDTFVFGQGDGNDTILDFSGNDTLDLSNLGGTITWDQLLAKISSTSDGVSATIDLSEWGGGTVTLIGVNPNSLTQDMFNLPDGDTTTNASGVFQDPDVDTVYMGTSGNDTIEISSTDNVLVSGGEGDDTITTGSGHDILKGGEGDDTLKGNAGDDLLMGGEGSDTLIGDAGEDWLVGGEGDDTLTGGADADTFIFSPGHGNDSITDFTVDSDTINLSLYDNITSFDQLTITQNGTDAVIDLSGEGGGTITLENVNLNDLDAEDFSFYVPPAAETDAM